LDKLSQKHHISLEECGEKGIQIDCLLSHIQESAEDRLIKSEMLKKLALCLDALSGQERMLIYSLFFKGKSERELCAVLGVAKTTLHDRKQKILNKLKNMLEI
jgi:RNA polymerase sigma factor (sigma-70 family)